MKNLIKAFFFLVLFCGASELCAQDYRDVYWLHGMNGDETRWANYAEAFGGTSGLRQMNSSLPTFPTTGSVDEITTGINGEFTPAPDNIGVGASLGGIVLRNLEVIDGDPSELGGIITVHAPHLGASIARSVNNGDAEEYLNHVVSTIAEALREIEEHLTSGFSFWDVLLGGLNIIVSLNPLNEILNVAIELIASGAEIPSEEEITSQITLAFGLLNSPNVQDIFDDMDPTSDFMDNLNSYESTLPRIEMHGYEGDKEPFRMGCSLEKTVWAQPLAETSAVPDGDCQIFEDLSNARSQLNNAQIALNAKAALNTVNLTSWLSKKRRPTALFEAAGDVKDAKNLIKYGMEEGWEGLMTGTVPVMETVNQMSVACATQLLSLEQELLNVGVFSPEGIAILEQIHAINSDPSCFEEVQVINYVNDPNARYDGLFLDAEQVSGEAIAEYENSPINGNGVNHAEMLNHPSSWNNFNLIFDTDGFFKTPPR